MYISKSRTIRKNHDIVLLLLSSRESHNRKKDCVLLYPYFSSPFFLSFRSIISRLFSILRSKSFLLWKQPHLKWERHRIKTCRDGLASAQPLLNACLKERGGRQKIALFFCSCCWSSSFSCSSARLFFFGPPLCIVISHYCCFMTASMNSTIFCKI